MDFTKTPKWLRLSNALIYPFYIFHQTVIVVIGYYIITWQAAISEKVISLFALSFIVTSAARWFIIKSTNFLRFLFGVKPENNVVPVAYNKSNKQVYIPSFRSMQKTTLLASHYKASPTILATAS